MGKQPDSQPTPNDNTLGDSISLPRSWRLAAVAAAVGLVAIATAFLVSSRSTLGSSIPVRASFTHNAVHAIDSAGHEVWSHTFSQSVDLSESGAPLPLAELVRFIDLEGDDREMVIVAPLKTGPNTNQPDQVEVDCFSSRGKFLWSYVPHEKFTFGEHEISGPWVVTDVFVASPGPSPSVWVTVTDSPWGNSFVVQLDPKTGKGTVRFVNTGVLYRLNELTISGHNYILAGGFNNEYEAGSLAVIDQHRPFAASPQTTGTRHKCVSCPSGDPDYFLIFPRSEINQFQHIYEDPIREIQIVNGKVEVRKDALKNIDSFNTMYLLDPANNFNPVSLRYDSGYDMLHRELSDAHKLSHSLENCPERAHPSPIRLWTPANSWITLPIKPAKSTD